MFSSKELGDCNPRTQCNHSGHSPGSHRPIVSPGSGISTPARDHTCIRPLKIHSTLSELDSLAQSSQLSVLFRAATEPTRTPGTALQPEHSSPPQSTLALDDLPAFSNFRPNSMQPELADSATIIQPT